MPHVSVFLGVSLDGFIAREDGTLDWLERFQDPSEDFGYAAFMSEVDTLVMGRNTHDTVLGFGPWPFEGKRVVVLTNRPLEANNGEETHAGPLTPLMERFDAEGVKHVYLDGGVAVRHGLAEGLVDRLTLSWIPVQIGQGRRLFEAGLPPCEWNLERVERFENGIVQIQYNRQESIVE